jgi:acyl-CoA synthetase (NDP forming)
MAVEPVLSHQAIARFLRPQSVAVVGASDKPGALGATLLSNLQRNGYAGAIYPVNPKRSEIAGLTCYPSTDALPEGVDVAVLAIRGWACSMRCAAWRRARRAGW